MYPPVYWNFGFMHFLVYKFSGIRTFRVCEFRIYALSGIYTFGFMLPYRSYSYHALFRPSARTSKTCFFLEYFVFITHILSVPTGKFPPPPQPEIKRKSEGEFGLLTKYSNNCFLQILNCNFEFFYFLSPTTADESQIVKQKISYIVIKLYDFEAFLIIYIFSY